MTINDAIDRIDRHAPFLRGLALRHPDIADALAQGADPASFGRVVDDGDPARDLRIARQRLALGLAIADLAGIATLEQVVIALSDFADLALDRAIRAAIAERGGDPAAGGFAALALGKHGSRELNYSSDIDPILIFDPDTLPRRGREEPVEAAVRIARRVVELLQTPDGNGYVLRVDLRLRPSPEASPLALPVDAAISYYESSALAWERAAFIRARAAAGDIALGQDFLAAVRPFVWRKGLDFGAVREIRDISRRIRDHHAQGQSLGPGYDIKRGRGGIREVEFFAQIHQLIHGGRDPALRAPATLDALAALGAAGRIDADACAALSAAYRLHRTIEHRLQMVADQQTHSLPARADALDNVARLHGLPDGPALIDLLRPHVDAVGRIYDGIDPVQGEGIPRDPVLLDMRLGYAGFADAPAARARIEAWRGGGIRALRTPAAHEALEAVLPQLITYLGRAVDPATAINRFDALVSGLPSAINLFRLLEAQPSLLRLLGEVLALAPALADALGRRPSLLDGLIDASALDPAPDVDALVAEFSAGEADDDYQALLDRVRRLVGERRFALGVQLVAGSADPLEVAAGYARVAEAALVTLARATVAEFARDHGRIAGSELLILALGRLGGGALTHASDLDLIFLYSGAFDGESDGRRPLGPAHYFNRLASRVIAAMSVATAAGPLYDIDTRLRPSGAQGPLAVSIESFDQYQRESAWTWEHMALTRARSVFGSDAGRAALDAIVTRTLERPRDRRTLIEDAVKMRGDIARHKPPAGDCDVKLVPGGLVDIEFSTHVLQLSRHLGLTPRLRTAAGDLAQAGLLDPGIVDAHELMTRMLVTLRLVSPQSGAPPESARPLVATACRQPGWDALVAAYAQARALVSAEWARITDHD